ncbi:carboxypeptidase-like regulatory domain-containing protein [Hymenobacter endophyticus]|uniref:Carboxypeptidase-like regulatory domain-containing protein n=1 Tax=Hymenobacter endophyticus TaxID=3076335 RepID=A0ABU3TKT5_9BACT|nr:carboxypeptidase-like regulatory domain-containing protein [Hymenobacter endophyticus]MDU0371984.1 carboxypeptidase-like regulatory domain-containing protein [Hymenobacter endophyticus]
MRSLFPALTTGLLLAAATTHSVQAQQATRELFGSIQTDAGEPLPGATVFIKGTYIGCTTNSDGAFRLVVPISLLPASLSVSFVGFETAALPLDNTSGTLAPIILQPSPALVNEVVVSASRVEENILRTGVTVDKLNTQQLSRLTMPDLITGLARQKGVDVTTSGMFMASASTRGFGGATSERLVQLVDYMDTQSPSLNINAGNALGLPEVDMASVEVLHGPSSALYGANAFNGVVLTNSKDPFQYEGLSVRLRGGNRDYLDGQLRYALRLGRKVAFKISGSYARANDWIASNNDALSQLYAPGNNAAGSGLGYDAVNRYGDVGNTFNATGGALAGKTVFMPGWSERELIGGDNRAQLYRVIPSVHWLISDKLKAAVEFKRAEGTTAYQFTNRYRFKNFATNQWRAELKSDNGFLRAYQTQDFGNDSYDLPFTGAFMQSLKDPNSAAGLTYAQQYFQAYAVAYNTYLALNPGNTAGAEQAARTKAAPYQLAPGTPAFDAARQRVIEDATPGVGSRINPSSLLNDISGQYNFKTDVADIVLGGAYRQYRLGSNGQLFSDRDGKRILNDEYGAYLQLTKELLSNRLKMTAAGRIDDSRNFESVFSPRASAVFSLDKQQLHNLRGSYNQAYRSPTQQGQYLSLDLARVLLLGNISNGFLGYSTAAAAQLGRILSNPATAQTNLDAYAVKADRLKPERVATWEIGYKGLLLPNLVLDVNYYNSRYNDFIGQVRLISNVDGTKPTVAQIGATAATPRPFQTGNTRVIQVQANANQEVKASGSVVALTYTAFKALSLTGNYTLNLLNRDGLPEGFQTYYNTPKHKYNVGAYGEVAKVLTYSVNYRWAQGHLFESPFAAGQLRAYSSLDAQLGYALPKLHTTLQVGGSNLANARNIQVYGGPQVGRLVYAGLSLDLK